jgi:hypothetical protein
MINTPEEIVDITETKTQIETRLRAEFPELRRGSEDIGYEVLDSEAYEAIIADWVENQLSKIEKKKSEIAKEEARQALLDKLGISQDEAKLLLS